MDRQVSHPTKEQVRAYMLRREADRRPPPAPAEIRRQLGWRLAPVEQELAVVQFCLLPSTYGQLSTQLLMDWLYASSSAISAFRTR